MRLGLTHPRDARALGQQPRERRDDVDDRARASAERSVTRTPLTEDHPVVLEHAGQVALITWVHHSVAVKYLPNSGTHATNRDSLGPASRGPSAFLEVTCWPLLGGVDECMAG